MALWAAWRRASRGNDPWASRVVTAGFLLRAVAGLALFWISYLGLPVMPSHTLGEGFWDFALDATYYMPLARAAASRGLFAIVTLDRGAWSAVSFLQILCLAQVLFGYVTSLGLLLNCGFFLGGALSLLRWSSSLGLAGRYPGLLALAVLSLHPSWILWSTQPLKDPLFGLLVIAWFCASRYWFDSSVQPGAGRRRLLCALVLTVVIYELAGMRAYFALILWLAFAAGLVFSLLRPAPLRRWRRLVVSAGLWIFLFQVVVWSGGPLLPPALRAFDPASFLGAAARLRDGFVSSGGASQIGGTGAAMGEWSSSVLTGLAAIFLPRFVGTSLGLFSIGGGRGAWAFVELDTLFFLVACIYSGVLTVRAARRAAGISPLALQALLSALLIAVGLAYVVTNFGTLLRLREMILMPLSLAPLAATVASSRARETAARARG